MNNVMGRQVFVERCRSYDQTEIDHALRMFDHLFAQAIEPGQTILLKPNWIAPHHKYRVSEWVAVLTHPRVVTGVIKRTLSYLEGSGTIIIADGPQTDSSFEEILALMPVDEWRALCKEQGVELQILDLRDHQWTTEGGVVVDRRNLLGDPLGSVEYNLPGPSSEFCGHQPSKMGYCGADCDLDETTAAHSNGNQRYRISKTAVRADLFINIPKWKTHKKAGITCSLKNLVGINTYKNFLPHHTEGTPMVGGDQFPDNRIGNFLEVHLLEWFKWVLHRYEKQSRCFIPLKRVGKVFFGETTDKVRSGNWHGNNTLWRTILDLNKLLFYGNVDGTMRRPELSERKRYLTFIDGIVAGEGNGPEAPDPIETGIIIAGTSPVAADCVATKLMGFDYTKIPTVANAFEVRGYPLVDYSYRDITVASSSVKEYNNLLANISDETCFQFRPHFGWMHHVEL